MTLNKDKRKEKKTDKMFKRVDDHKTDWIDIMVKCGCNREHKWKIHGVDKNAWVEKTK